MYNNKKFLYRDPWDISELEDYIENNKYICLSGNSGTGKSTKLRQIAEDIYKIDAQTIAIDEKNLHHPFLPCLFFEPENYGYQIQINFMIQRSLLIKKWLDLGYNLVMERSHIEDIIFIEHFYRKGFVNKNEYKTYVDLWSSIDKRTPHPDIIIFCICDPKKSIDNVTSDELTGKRPKEFSGNEEKQEWIISWHRNYLDFLQVAKTKYVNTKIYEIKDQNFIDDVILHEIRQSIRRI